MENVDGIKPFWDRISCDETPLLEDDITLTGIVGAFRRKGRGLGFERGLLRELRSLWVL